MLAESRGITKSFFRVFGIYWKKQNYASNFFRKTQKQEAQSHCNIFRQGGTEILYWTYNIWFQKRNAFLRKKIVDRDHDGMISQ